MLPLNSKNNKKVNTTPGGFIDLSRKNNDPGCDMGTQCGIVTSVGLKMPAAFTVINSPITTSGVITVNMAGLITQYLAGDGSLLNFPINVSYFNNDAGYITNASISGFALKSTVLTINGISQDLSTNRTWVVDGLPSQIGEAGKWLSTNGGVASWDTLSGNVSLFTNDSGYITSADLSPYLLSSTAAATYTPLSRILTINGEAHDLSTDRTWTISTTGSVWGLITGTLSDQTDLQAALNAKQDVISLGSTSQYFRGDLSLATFPTNVSTFTNDVGYLTSSSLTGYVQNTRTLTINGVALDLSANRSWTVGTVTSVAATAGTAISITGSPITGSGTINITNTAPDQTVVLTNGTGISATGTYPNFTITNTAPDQTVSLSAGSGISITGTYPSFTITNTAPSTSGTVTNFSFTNGNGIVGNVTNPTTTPVLSLSTNVTGIVKANGTSFSALTVGSGLTYDGTTLSANSNIQDGIISGGVVTWLHDYVYNVSPAVYAVGGIVYNSASTDITLASSDPTLDRIDIFVLTSSSTAIAITGTPSTPAVEPDYDAATQLLDSFATVDAASTSPTVVNNWIYLENTEWTTSASAGTINPASTNSPYAGTKDVEGTAVANNQFITFTSPTTPTMGSYQNLVFEIRSKANWSTTKKWIIRWYNGTTAIGNPVNFGQSSYGFVSTNTTTYQTITIPLTDFGTISTATRLRITQSNTSGTIGWFLDNIQLQSAGGGGTPTTITLTTDVTGTGTNTISTTVTGIRNKSIPTLSAGFLKYTGSAWTFDNSTYLTANQAITVTATGDATGTSTSSGTAPSLPLTLATVNGSPGTFGSASQTLTATVNGKGLITSLSAQSIAITASQVSGISATSPITYSGGTISTSMSTNKLIGRSTAGSGVMEQISIGTGLTLSSGTLSVGSATDFVNVIDYGADRTGVSDSTAAINSAINNGTRYKVYMPAGTYKVTTSELIVNSQTNKRGIELISGIELFGDGVENTIITTGNNTTGTVIDTYWYPIINGFTTEVSDVIIHDLQISGNQTNQAIYTTDPYTNPRGHGSLTDHKSVQGILFKSQTSVANNKVYNVYAHHCQGYGVEMFNILNAMVSNCKLTDNGNGGIGYVGVDATLITTGLIKDNLVTNNNSDNVSIVSCGDVYVINNELSFAKTNSASPNWFAGLYVDRTKNVHALNNYVHDNSAYGIDLGGGTSDSTSGEIIKGNHIRQNGNGGIVTLGNSVITNNIIHDNGKMSNGTVDSHSPYNPGAISTNATVNTVISNNHAYDSVSGTQTYFIKTYGGSPTPAFGFKNCIITNNRIENIADIAHAYNGDDGTNIILGNTITDGSSSLVNPGTNGQALLITSGVPKWGNTVSSVGISSTDLSVSGSPVTTSGSITLNVNSNAITYAKIQTVGASKLLGNPTGSTANASEISLGTGLDFTGTSLEVTPNTTNQKLNVLLGGSSVGTRKALNFIQGTNIVLTVTDNSGSDRVDVTVDATGGGGGGGTVTSVTGTVNRIAVTNPTTTPTVDIDSNYVGQASITTLGTVTTGTWSATTIATNKGGTGQTSYTDGQLLIGNSSGSTLTKSTLTAGGNISITNGNGSITIAASSPSLAAASMFNYLNFF